MAETTIYITRYSLTKGIIKNFDANVYFDVDGNLVAKCKVIGIEQILYGNDFFTDKEEAITYSKNKYQSKVKTLIEV